MCQKLFQKAFWSIIIRKKRQKAILRLKHIYVRSYLKSQKKEFLSLLIFKRF